MTAAGSVWLLPALVVVPLAGSLVLLALRRLDETSVARLGAAVAALTAALGVAAAVAAAPYDRARPGLAVDASWIPALGVRAHLALDGVAAPLVLLTVLLGLLVCWHLVRVRPVAGRIHGLVACYLAVEGGALAVFTARDLLLFFVAFEVVLVPMWFVIAFWGDTEQRSAYTPMGAGAPRGEAARRDAANRFLLYTALGSAVMLIGLLLVALRNGTTDLDVLTARAAGADGGQVLTGTEQVIAAALIVGGLAVKVPMFPLHTWLPPAHTVAPTGGSVLLAGVLLKLGTYGLVRVAVPIVPQGVQTLAPILGTLGVVGILWGGLVCYQERDLKRLVAFSSVAHMGFVLVGIASLTAIGLQGALFANVAHGLVTGLLFLVVGALKDRHHSADLSVIGPDLRDRLPRLGWLLAFGGLAALGLPGLAGFWGELLAIAGTWSSGALGAWARPLAVLAAVGTAVAAAYVLRVLRLVWHGPLPVSGAGARAADALPDIPTSVADAGAGARPADALPDIEAPVTMGDATLHEVSVTGPLVLAVTVLGVLPWVLLDVTGPAVRGLLALGGGSP